MDISLEITKLIKDTLKKINIEDANFIVEIPNNKTNGDYSTNVAMELTKKLHKNPKEIAELIPLLGDVWLYPNIFPATEEEIVHKFLFFKEMLEKRCGLPVILWDERLTTVAADRSMMETGIRRENRNEYVDEIAANFILQGYLDYLSNHPEEK